ncbi:liver-expressed antimicrobial peptide 2 [Carettochelys insculpta]|uniref:liver-expressed antimicrobial peptide 2 n=1 Tax=Carettochelys insculpta TaxID=44489 RepID=UPI003EBC23E5
MASWLPTAPGGAGTRKALLVCAVLLLLSAWQGTSGPAGSRMLLSTTASLFPSPPAALGSHPAEGPARRRAGRMTPFWRMVGSKPLGAYCRHGLECSTSMCRFGRCAPPRYEC